ncbi:MAG: hypothetical protein ACOC3W_07990 [Thermodesulfobacteriota bacterium]
MKPKLIGLFLLTGLIPLVVVGVWSSILGTDALMEKSYEELRALREIKKGQIERIGSFLFDLRRRTPVDDRVGLDHRDHGRFPPDQSVTGDAC